MKTLLLGTTLALVAGPLSGQEAEPPAFPTMDEVVFLDVVVRDADGEPVTDLRADEVEILEDGMPPRAFPLAAASPQQYEPTRHDRSVRIGGDVSQYEAMYGTPEFRGIDDEMGRPWPQKHSTVTVGEFVEVPGRGPSASAAGRVGRPIEFQNQLSSHMVCGERHCVAVVPVYEMGEFFATAARSWLRHRVEVTGAIDDINKSPGGQPIWAFRMWSISLRDDGPATESGPTASALESLVTSPGALAGETIVAEGVFRGANLFDDMPQGSQQRPGDWVLKDGPFFVWVTGKDPKGSGFSLDPTSRSDCRWRLEVTGTVETRDGLVYLKAKRIRLLGPAPGQST